MNIPRRNILTGSLLTVGGVGVERFTGQSNRFVDLGGRSVSLAADGIADVELRGVASRQMAASTSFPDTMTFVRTDGYASPGDGGAAIYGRVDEEPDHPAKFQSADGSWWEIAPGGVTVAQLGAVGDGTTDNAGVIATIKAAAEAGLKVHFPDGVWATSKPLNFASPVHITMTQGAEIKLLAPGAYVMQLDYSYGGDFFDHLGFVENCTLNGNGFAVDGLVLKGVISASFPRLRVKNVKRSGLHLCWAQMCVFDDYLCSGNVEPFTTTPVHGILVDGAYPSSANTFIHPVIEQVSGDAILGAHLWNSTFVGGCPEGNGGTGYRFGLAGSGLTAIGNSVWGGDIEVNKGGDVIVDEGALGTDLFGLKAGFGTDLSVRIMNGAVRTTLRGGTVGSVQIDSGASYTTLDNVSFIGNGKGLIDNGTSTTWRGLRNLSDGVLTPDSNDADFIETELADGETYQTNAQLKQHHFVYAMGATLIIANPTNPRGGQIVAYTIFRFGADLTTTWGAAFKTTGWADPTISNSGRSISFVYNAQFLRWYPVSIGPNDVPFLD